MRIGGLVDWRFFDRINRVYWIGKLSPAETLRRREFFVV